MLLLSALKYTMATILISFNTFSTIGDRWKPLSFYLSILKYVKLLVWTTNARSQPCLQVLFFTLNYQLKSGVHNDITFNYQYRNWLFGFTIALSLMLPVIIIKLISCRKSQQWWQYQDFLWYFTTADENQIHVWK